MAEVDEILLSWGPGESRLALLAEGRLIGLTLDRPALVAGGVFLGRVAEVNPRLDAAFVDIGMARPGFLAGAKALGLSKGRAVVVQVKADAHSTKGATLTADIALRGRFLQLQGAKPGITAARRLAAAERERLLPLVEAMADPAEGVTLRSAAGGCEADRIRAELDSLRADRAALDVARAAARAPALLWRPTALARMLADHPRTARVLIDDAGAFAEAKTRFPDLIWAHKGGDLFADHGVDEAIDAALDPVVGLRGGGRLTIEPTAALTAIDIDSGTGAPAEANRHAVDAIAHQLRLRAIGGQVVVDFVPGGGGKGALLQLGAALKKAVAADPVPTHVFGPGPLGMVEMTRERRGPSLAELMLDTATARRPDAVAFEALRRLLAAGRPQAALAVAPEVARALAAMPDALAEAGRRLGTPVKVRPEPGRTREDIAIAEAPR